MVSSGISVVSLGFFVVSFVVSFVVVFASEVVSLGLVVSVSVGFTVSVETEAEAVTVRIIETDALLPSKSVTENVTG